MGRILNFIRSKLAPNTYHVISGHDSPGRWSSETMRSLTPQVVEQALRDSMAGDSRLVEIFELMEDRWCRLAHNINTVKQAVIDQKWTVKPYSVGENPPSEVAKRAALFVEEALWGMRPPPTSTLGNSNEFLSDIMDGYYKGQSVVQIVWKTRRSRLGPIVAPLGSAWVHPSFYGYDENGNLELKSKEHPEGFTPQDFIIARYRFRSTHPSAGARIRPLAWWWACANFCNVWQMELAQKFGQPIRWATYDSASPDAPALKNTLNAALAEMGAAAYATMPQGTNLNLLVPNMQMQDSPQVAIRDYADKLCDIYILGQTLTSDVGDSGSRALGDVHASVRGDMIAQASDWLLGVLNAQFVPAVLERNGFLTAEIPEIQAEPEGQEDAMANAQRDQILASIGAKFPEKYFNERHGIPNAGMGETLIVAPAASQPQPVFGKRYISAKAGDDTLAKAKAQILEARTKALEPVANELDKLAKDLETIPAEAIPARLEAFRKAVPSLFNEIDHDAQAKATEGALGAAIVEAVK